MSEIIYLGKVKNVNINQDKNYCYATVEPAVKSTTDRMNWAGGVENIEEEFPGRGLVYWHDAPKCLCEGNICQFEIQEHPHYAGEPHKEAYQVNNAKIIQITEIVDVRYLGTECDIREMIIGDGLALAYSPFKGACILRIADNNWVGPIELEKITDKPLWVIWGWS